MLLSEYITVVEKGTVLAKRTELLRVVVRVGMRVRAVRPRVKGIVFVKLSRKMSSV
jgi:hypothetical protein